MVTPQATLPSIIFFGVESSITQNNSISVILLCILDDTSYDICRSNNDFRFEVYTLTFGLYLILVKILSNSDPII
jgi:hypothetical protein